MTQHPVADSKAKRGNAHVDTGESTKRHKSTSGMAADEADSSAERTEVDEDSKAKPAPSKGKGVTRKTRQNGGAVAAAEAKEESTITQSISKVDGSVEDGSVPKISGGVKDTDVEARDTSAEAKEAVNTPTTKTKTAAKDVQDALKDILNEVKGTPKEINDLGWIPENVLKRLHAAASRVQPDKGRHALAEIPADKVTWGGYANTFMCYKGKVVTAVFVGRVISTWFRNSDNTLPSCPSLKFKFLRDLDETAARALVYDKARPPRVTSKKTFWTGKRCSTLDAYTKEWHPFEFSDVYDGTQKVLKHADMDVLPSSRLHNNDLVMLECQINRFVPDQRKPVFTSARIWETRFRLMSVVKLYEPKGVRRDEESSEESEVREDSDEEMEGF